MPQFSAAEMAEMLGEESSFSTPFSVIANAAAGIAAADTAGWLYKRDYEYGGAYNSEARDMGGAVETDTKVLVVANDNAAIPAAMPAEQGGFVVSIGGERFAVSEIEDVGNGFRRLLLRGEYVSPISIVANVPPGEIFRAGVASSGIPFTVTGDDGAPVSVVGAVNAMARIAAAGDPNPAPPNADWLIIAAAAFDPRAAYARSDYARDGGNLYQASEPVAAPQDTNEQQTSYAEEATYNVGGSGNTAGAADYFQSQGDLGLFGIGVFCNANAASGVFPADRTGTFRLRIVGGDRDGASVTGTMENYRNFLGRHAFYIDSPAAMRAAFGTVDFASGGGVWHLERVTVQNVVVPGADNPLPSADADNWDLIMTPDWDGRAAYPRLSIVSQAGVYYGANVDIAASPDEDALIITPEAAGAGSVTIRADNGVHFGDHKIMFEAVA